MHDVQAALEASRRLIFYQGVTQRDPVVRALLALLEGLAAAGDAPGGPDRAGLWQRARELTAHLMEGAAAGAGWQREAPAAGPRSPWLGAIVEAVLLDANPFSRAAARSRSLGDLPGPVVEAAAHDLRCLQALASLRPESLEQQLRGLGLPWPAGLWAWAPASSPEDLRPRPDLARALHRRFAAASDFADCLPDLAACYRTVGPGVVGRYAVLRWDGEALVGIARPDPVRLEHLVGYEHEREQVVRNTERFVAGARAHHLLLYGPRGTGKSATVKALAAAFADRGLRLVELPLRHLSTLPRLLEELGQYGQRFVVFVDDVSFGEADGPFKELKATLEGSAQVCPANVLVYATSNRRHLVQEVPAGDGWARPGDEVNERLSLADRFGVTVFFPPCDQALYLRIVEDAARRAGIAVTEPGADGRAEPGQAIDRETLHRMALQWALCHDDRSPRTAVQFVTELAGELRIRSL